MRTFPKLSKRPNEFGYYEIEWSVYERGRWRSRTKSTKTGDRKKAEAALARLLTLHEAGAEADIPALVDVAEQYFKTHSKPKGTEKSDRQNLRGPVGAFGDWPLTLIKHDDVDAYARDRMQGKLGRAVKPATVRREITALQAVMNWASKKRFIPGRPTFQFDKPSENYEPRDRWLTEDQEQDLLGLISDAPLTVRLFTHLGLTYGVRKGALMDLKFGPQVQFVSNSIDFNVPGRPKVRKRRPVVAMTRTIRAEMEEMFQSKGRDEYVLDRNTPYLFTRTMEEVGYDWVTPHVLKHTAITLMLRQGVSPADVAKLTATDIRTILTTYRHHNAAELLSLAERRGI